MSVLEECTGWAGPRNIAGVVVQLEVENTAAARSDTGSVLVVYCTEVLACCYDRRSASRMLESSSAEDFV